MPSPTQRWGAAQETTAEETLIRHGYAIVERNWRGGGGEVDRIAWDDEVLCFVEVRARSSASFGTPAETVGYLKQQRILRAAACYLKRFSAGMPMVRFDVVSIVDVGRGPAEISLIKNAFDGTA